MFILFAISFVWGQYMVVLYICNCLCIYIYIIVTPG